QHAYVRLDAGNIERIYLPDAEQIAQFRCAKRVEGRLFDNLGIRLGSELLDRRDEVGPPTAAMAPVVLALQIAQKQRWSITRGGVGGRLPKDSGHARAGRRGRDPRHRADEVLIWLTDLPCGRWVQIDTCQGVDIRRAQLALPGASTLCLFVVVSPCSEEVVLHIHHEQRRRVSHRHDSPSRAQAPRRRRASRGGLSDLMRIALEPLLYRRCPAQCNTRIVPVSLPALMYTAPTQQVVFPAGERRVNGTRRSFCHPRVHGPLHLSLSRLSCKCIQGLANRE